MQVQCDELSRMVGQKGKKKWVRTPKFLLFSMEKGDIDGWPFPRGCFFKFILVEYLDLMKGESLRLPEQLVNLLPIKVLPQRPHLAMAEFHCHPFQSVFPLLPCYCSDGGIVNYSPSWMKNPSELILVLFPIVLLMITQLPCRHSRA